MSWEDLFAPHSLLFAFHFLAFAPSEGEKKRRDLQLGRRDGEGMRCSPDFAPSDRPFASHSPEIARLDELCASSEEEGTRLARAFEPCTSEIAGQNLRGMSRELGGTGRDAELLWRYLREFILEDQKTLRRDLYCNFPGSILRKPGAFEKHQAGEKFSTRA